MSLAATGGDEVGCPHCGALQRLPRPRRASTIACGVCRTELERTTGRSLDAALALAATTFLLLIPANLEPFLTTSVLGVSRHSRLASGAVAMWTDGWALLAIAIGLFVVVFPLVRFGLLTAVLGAVRLGRRPAWLGAAFRISNELQTWAMSDVFLLGLWVAYARLASTIDVEIGIGGYAFIGAAIGTLLTRAALDKAAVWRLIGEERSVPREEAASACLSCELLVPAADEGGKCPRCGDTLTSREPQGVSRAMALTLAGLLLYIPANLLPIATLPIGLTPTKYTVLQGVIDLAQAGLLGLALLVFTASFAIPFLKLIGLGYCLQSVIRRSPRRLVFKTRVYRVVEEIGRWSMVDPFVIACFVPVMRYNDFIYGRAEPAAPAFAGVVVLTMLAARLFDPRRMWDAAAAPQGRAARERRLAQRPRPGAPHRRERAPHALARAGVGDPGRGLLVVLYLGLQALAHRGVDIVVSFGAAADAKPGDTQVVYKGLSIGRVTKVRLSPDRKHVDMTLRMSPQSQPILRQGTVFWLVGAKPSLTDINSVKAALAGVSIGLAPGEGRPTRRFQGLDSPPVVLPGTQGRSFDLISKAVNGAQPGASVFYHGQEVGKVTGQTLRDQNDFLTRIFVLAPYDRFVRRGTLFFNTSAVQVSFSGAGLSTQIAPGGAALSGGVEFDTPQELLDQPLAADGARFPLYPDKGRALAGPRGPQVFYTVMFTDPVGDLEVGSPVRLRGFQVGVVSARTLRYEPGSGLLTTPVTVALEPDRLNPANGLSDPTADLTGPSDALVSRLLAQGYRARLSQQPPLVGGRVVDLVRVPGARGGGLLGARGPLSFPVIPSTSSGDIDAIMGKVDDILSKVQQVPIAEIGADVRGITSRLSSILNSPKLNDSIGHLEDTLDRVDATVKEAQPKIGPMIDNLNKAADQIQSVAASANALVSTDGSTQDASVPGALRELTDAARSLRALSDYLSRHPEAILRGKAKPK